MHPIKQKFINALVIALDATVAFVTASLYLVSKIIYLYYSK